MYGFYLIAGLWAIWLPSQAILTALQAGLTYLWCGFMALGGGLSLYGSLRGQLSGELIGIPLLSASNMIFAFAIFGYTSSPTAFSVGYVFLGVGLGLFDRWAEIRVLLKLTRNLPRDDGDSDGS